MNRESAPEACMEVISEREQFDRAAVWYDHRSLWKHRAATPWSSLPSTGTKTPPSPWCWES